MVAVAIAKTKWNVTPSLRVAAFSHRNKIGQPVLVDVDLKTKLCKHGETSSTIRTWLWATLGTHVVALRGSYAAPEGGEVSVGSFIW